MHTPRPSHPSFNDRLFARESWIGPASGFVCGVAVLLIGRTFELEYRRELSSGVFFLVMVLVGGYYNGKLSKEPFAVVGWALLGACIGVAISHWGPGDPGIPNTR